MGKRHHHESLLEEIDGFLAESGMGQSYFGKKAVGNSEIVQRLRDNRRCWPDTEERIRVFISAERQRRNLRADESRDAGAAA